METFIGCSAVIYDENNRVLIAQRGKNKKQCSLLWETVGGALENGETPEECILREVREELHCDLYNIELFKVYVINEKEDRRHVLIVFRGQIRGDIKFNYEIEQIKWIEEKEIGKYNFCWNCKQKLVDYFERER